MKKREYRRFDIYPRLVDTLLDTVAVGCVHYRSSWPYLCERHSWRIRHHVQCNYHFLIHLEPF